MEDGEEDILDAVDGAGRRWRGQGHGKDEEQLYILDSGRGVRRRYGLIMKAESEVGRSTSLMRFLHVFHATRL